MRQSKWAVAVLLAALMALVALPGCFWRVDDGHRDRHEEHREGERHDEGRHDR